MKTVKKRKAHQKSESVPLDEYIQKTKGKQIARGMEASKERKKDGHK